MSPKVSREHIEKRRTQILEAAKRVFMKKGFEPSTMQDVIVESDMSRGGVYQYFSNTEDMWEALHANGIEETTHYINNLVEQHETVWAALTTYLKGYEYVEDTFGMVSYEYTVTAWRNERHRQFIKQHAEEAINTYVNLLQAGIDNGEFNPQQDLADIARFIINVTDGIILEHGITGLEPKSHVDGLLIYLRSALGI